MTWPNVTVGRLTLREVFDFTPQVNTGTNKRTLGLRGEESYPPLDRTAFFARNEDILGLTDRFVPIIFGDKSEHNGFYIITDSNTEVTVYGSESGKFAWTIQAQYVGPLNAIDVESRLAYVVRANDFGLAGERWHAPAGGSVGYYTGSNLPSASVDRPSVDGGPVTVYRGLPAGFSPRWAAGSLTTYARGRARVLVGSVERTATTAMTVGASAWELNNGLVSVSAAPSASATIQYALWDGAAWDTKLFNISVSGSTTDLGVFDSASVIRNDYEAVTVRLLKGKTAAGRSQVDLTLRRGAHFVEGYLQTESASTMAVYVKTAEAGTAPASAGYIAATANDAAGNRYIIGSARTFTALTVQGGIQKTAATTLDFFVGASLAGGSASASNAATALRDQFLVFNAEQSMGVRR
jgi:hypothetical protein